MPRFSGAMPAIVTPMKGDDLDLEALKELADWQVSEGCTGIVACGTTGEGATLTAQETLAVVAAVKDAVGGKVPIIAGTGSNDTRKSVELTRQVRELGGVEAALVVTPYYNKPTADGLYAHYEAIASGGGLPVIMYNVPGRTGLDMSLATILRCASIDGVIGIKEASKNMEKAVRIRDELGPDFDLLSGDDFTILPFLSCGGDGVITVVGNVAPADTAALVAAWHDGDVTEARRLQAKLLPLVEALFVESNPIPVKAMLARMGKIEERYRAPLTPPTEEGRAKIEKALQNYGGLL